MRDTRCLILGLVVLWSLPAVAWGVDAQDEWSCFPEIPGWTHDSKPTFYTPQTLFEYINGAAELYLRYDFRELAVMNYETEDGRFLSIDIYRHGDVTNAFGVYSRERSTRGFFLSIGSQGYAADGSLNLLKGQYYVKLSSYGLGESADSLLTEVATEVAVQLPGETDFPLPLQWFPLEGRIKNTEQYVSRDFLGHEFLHSAFVADYELEGEEVEFFLLVAEDRVNAQTMVSQYLRLAGEDLPEDIDIEGHCRITDPYDDSHGLMNLRWRERYVWGLFCDNASVYELLLERMAQNIPKGSRKD